MIHFSIFKNNEKTLKKLIYIPSLKVYFYWNKFWHVEF